MVKSFNSPIGYITNLASTFIAMKYNFLIDSDEYKELSKRVNLLRGYQGNAIKNSCIYMVTYIK